MKYIKGGSLTGNQLYGFFDSQYLNDDHLVPDGFKALDKTNHNLFNDNFRCYYNLLSNQIVILHMGSNRNSYYDIGNNLRNMIATKTQLLRTTRNEIAETGHNAVKKFLKKIYDTDNTNSNFKNIIQYINKMKMNNPDKTISTEDCVDEFLLNKLTTIGHSQGAIYCYLYGNIGKEIIVFNPAPFNNTKPDNVYEIIVKGDLISGFSGNTNKPKKFLDIKDEQKTLIPLIYGRKKYASMIDLHKTSNLKGESFRVGNKFLYSNDTISDAPTSEIIPDDIDIIKINNKAKAIKNEEILEKNEEILEKNEEILEKNKLQEKINSQTVNEKGKKKIYKKNTIKKNTIKKNIIKKYNKKNKTKTNNK